METINLNHVKLKSYVTLVEDVVKRLATNHMGSIDPFVQGKNYDVNDWLNKELQNLNTDEPSMDDFT